MVKIFFLDFHIFVADKSCNNAFCMIIKSGVFGSDGNDSDGQRDQIFNIIFFKSPLFLTGVDLTGVALTTIGCFDNNCTKRK